MIIDPKTQFNEEIKNEINGKTIKVHNSKIRSDVSLLNGYKPIYVFCQRGMKSKLKNRLKTITYDVRGNGNLYEDIIWNTSEPKIKLHEHEQSEDMMRSLITMFSKSDDVILEPFTGSGTTLRVGREPEFKIKEIIGVEIDDNNIKTLEKLFDKQASCLTQFCNFHQDKNP